MILFGTLMAVSPAVYVRMLGPIWPERAPRDLGYRILGILLALAGAWMFTWVAPNVFVEPFYGMPPR